MKIYCPDCNRELPLEDVNVSTDVALCRKCGQTFGYAELLADQATPTVNLQSPPKGVWFERHPDGFEVGTTTRSAIAFFLVPFMCVWSGGSLGGIYGGQIVKGEFNLMLSLFGIPFLLGTILFGSIALMAVCGKTSLRVQGDDACIFTGIGAIGIRRHFSWSGVTKIHRTVSFGKNRSEQITLEGVKRLNFASAVKAERMDFMLAVLRQMKHGRYQ